MNRCGLGADYASQITAAAPSYGIPPALALALATRESSLNPSAVSPKGAIGLFQLMPATAAGLHVDPNDPSQNIAGGLTYLHQLFQQYGDWGTALIAYNEGPGALARKGVYPSSQAYADSILSAAGLDFSTSTPDSTFGSPQSDFLDFAPLDYLEGSTGLSETSLIAIGAGVAALVLLLVLRHR